MACDKQIQIPFTGLASWPLGVQLANSLSSQPHQGLPQLQRGAPHTVTASRGNPPSDERGGHRAWASLSEDGQL